MGREFYPNAMWGEEGGGGEFKSKELKEYLNNIILQIHAKSHRPNLPINFAIQNSSIPNAWAIPGYVVITRGLLANLDNEAEFAYIMGHEMGHVAARHSVKQMTYGMIAQIGLTVTGIALSGKEYADAALGLGSIGSSLLLLKYSRNDELEADRLGIEYMVKIGYHPQNAINAHRNLEKAVQEYSTNIKKNKNEPSFLDELLSTHPRTSVRMEELERIITNYLPMVSERSPNREMFQEKIKNLKKVNKAYTDHYDKAIRLFRSDKLIEAENEIGRALNIDATQPAFYTLKGLIYLKKSITEKAEYYIDHALNLDNEYVPALRAKGLLNYNKRKFAEATNFLEKAVHLYPQDYISHFYAGVSYYNLSKFNVAKNFLFKVAQAIPNHQEVHGYLGLCYEKIGNLNNAYREYNLQLQINPNNELGKLSLQRIKVLRTLMFR